MIYEKQKVNIIGLGYIGLPTGLMLAAHDVEVVGTDYNEKLVSTLNSGVTTFEEKGLEELFGRAREKGMMFSTSYITTSIYIIAVPTPYNDHTKKIDAKYVIRAIENVLDVCPKGAVIVIESTISPGTTDKFIRPIITNRSLVIGTDIHLVHAPERIIPGNMIYELEYNSRTIGADDRQIGDKVKAIYSSFCKGEIVITDIRTAEMTKVVENTFRDINIAFANELTKICRSDEMDVYEIINIANHHPRVNILQPGPGVGGHCISVDPWFLVGDYPGLANIILAARKINDSMPEHVLQRVHDIAKEKGITEAARIGFYGLTYKENVDDVRESPTLQLIDKMKKHLAPTPKTYDPYVKEDLFENQYHNLESFLQNIDMIVIMVAHDEILENIDKLSTKIILDTKNICRFDGVYKL
jgi:UDP-N-acetyl-D-mannosaminuronic acid dehydrogenase